MSCTVLALKSVCSIISVDILLITVPIDDYTSLMLLTYRDSRVYTNLSARTVIQTSSEGRPKASPSPQHPPRQRGVTFHHPSSPNLPPSHNDLAFLALLSPPAVYRRSRFTLPAIDAATALMVTLRLQDRQALDSLDHGKRALASLREIMTRDLHDVC
jgi:hypothetical protein